MLLSICACSKKELPQSLIGSYKCEVIVNIRDNGKQEADFNMVVHDDFTVTGQIGNAVLKNCRLEANRNDLGRKINIKTDYIVTGGSINGKIYDEDVLNQRDFTLPFNVENDTLKGSVMVLDKFKYPWPLCDVYLTK